MRPAAEAAPSWTGSHPPAPRIRGAGVVTGWSDGAHPGPAVAAKRRPWLVPAPTPVLDGDRFRRATRECLLAVAAAQGAVADAGLSPSEIAGPGTGIVYVSATGYAAANRAFLQDEASTTLHFPYTSPTAVPGEVTIELGIRGPYLGLMGGGPSTFQALWWAARWLAEGRADRLLVLAVEVFHEVRDLFGRARRLYVDPLVEGAACLLLEANETGALRWTAALGGPTSGSSTVAAVLDGTLDGARPGLVWSAATGAGRARMEARFLADRRAPVTVPRLGEALALGPLLALADAHRQAAPKPWLLSATWRSEYAALLWSG